MRRTQEDAAKTKQDILNAALTIFSQSGYEVARLNDIASAAEVTRGAIYHHFENKAGLFSALVEDASAIGGRAIQQAIEEQGSFTEVVTRILVYSMDLLEDDQRFREITNLTLFKTGDSPELADYKNQRIAQAQATIEGIAEYFKMGIAQGHIRADLDAITVARAFLAYQNGLSMLWLTNPKAFSIKESAADLADVFLKGILA